MRHRAGLSRGGLRRARNATCRLSSLAVLVWGLAVGAHSARAQGPNASAPVPLQLQTRAGQFEVVALDAGAAQVAVTVAGNVWRTLTEPLGLPTGYSSAIVVRLVPGARWQDAAAFRTVVEPGGVVTVLIGLREGVDEAILRRALVQGLLMRQAVALHGVTARLTAPLWLEEACIGWSLTRERPAQLDAWQQEAAQTAPPSLRELLAWTRGGRDARGWEVASLGLLGHLLAESPREGGWPALRTALLGGGSGLGALVRAYPALAADEATQEAWWLVGYHHQQTLSAPPSRSAAASREWLGDVFRVVLAREGRDHVLSLEDLFVARRDRAAAQAREERILRLDAELGRLHPFYRNAALSLGRTLLAMRAGDVEAFTTARTEFTRDLLDGRELEDASTALLDGR